MYKPIAMSLIERLDEEVRYDTYPILHETIYKEPEPT